MSVPTRPFGPTGVDVPVIGQGTWQLRDKKAAAEALAEGLRLGMTHVDTAELYTGSEEAIAPVLAGRRDDVFLVSKVLPRNASYEGTQKACDASLKRLGTDRLDVYLQHWRDDTFPLADTMRALEHLVDAGKTRFLGVSNFDVADLEEAKGHLRKHPIVCDQVLYHLGARGIEHELVPYCRRERIAVVAYSPFGSRGGFPPGGSAKRRVLDEIGKRHGRSAHQVALAFVTRDPVVFTIPKAESLAHVRDNAGGAFELAPRDLDEIDRAFPLPKRGEGLEML